MRMLSLQKSALCLLVLSVVASGCDTSENTPTSSSSSSSSSSASSASSSSSSSGAGGSGGIGGAGGTGGVGGEGGGIPDAPFTSKSDSNYEAQTSVAADSKGGIVAAWIAFYADFSSAIGYTVSRDDGKHWTAPAVIKSPGGRLATNPVVVADSKGVFSLVWAGFRADGGPTDEHIYVSRLDAGTETFPAPAIASDDGTLTKLDFDKPSVKVDASDDLLVTYADFTDNGMGVPASLVLARSSDGKTFQRTTITNDASFGNLAALCLDTTLGAMAPLYLVHLGNGGTVTLRTSTDKGMTWGQKTTPAAQVLFQDITCAVQGSNLWIAYASGSTPFMFGHDTPADVVEVMHSANSGTTFDPPVTASMGAAGDLFLYPQFIRTTAGKLAVVYYRGVVDAPGQLMLASSTNGMVWTNSPVASMGTFTTDRTIASWLGSYVGLAAAGTKVFTTYTENSENKAHVKFAEVALP